MTADMSHFFRALEQAELDRAARRESTGQEPAEPVAEPAAAVVAAAPPPSPPPTASSPPPPAASPAPPLDLDDVAQVDPHLVSLLDPTAAEADQYRLLRHAVENRRRTSGLTVVGVSSPGVGDGKTLTAINLAGALAQARDNRVLLIDVDLRRPSVARRLAMGAGPGLVDALVDPELRLEDVAHPRPPFELSVLTAGRGTATPYELLKSARLGDLLDVARARYDYVVVDTPPVVPFPDFRLINRWIDGCFLVLAAHHTRRSLVEEALDVLDPATLLGLVFNRDDGPMAAYRGRAYARPDEDRSPAAGLNGLRRWRGWRAPGRVA
jgi:capsular exopolysaccharide synthesis family protein